MKKRAHRRRRRMVCGLAVIGLLMLLAGPAFAEHAGDKLYRGIVNAATGWVEVPKTIYDESTAHDPFYGLIVGSVKGTGATLHRSASGGLDAGFFLIPPYDQATLNPDPATLL